MYNQQESGWAEGQLNENNERTDDLDGAAEGDNDTSRIGVLNQTAPSRPRSRDSYYDRERDVRDRGEPDYYGSSRSSRNHHPPGHHGGGEHRRRRNESYRDGRDRGRMDDYDYEYRDSRRSRHVPERQYPDPYYSVGGYGTSSRGGYGSQQGIREMLERLRIQDPVGYRVWYEQYQAYRRNPQRVPNPRLPMHYSGYGSMPNWADHSSNHSVSVYNEPHHIDRGGVHSGRSSVSELSLLGNGPLNPTPSINQEPDSGFKPIDPHYHKTPEPERMTPLKYNTSHCLGVLTPLGQLIKIKNEGSSVEIVQIKSLLSHLPDYKEIETFPGPLVKGTTHKNTVIQFCQKKIKEAQGSQTQTDRQHFILLWELLILLLRQNGNVVGSDVAELLLKSTSHSEHVSANDESQSKEINSEEEQIETGGVSCGGISNVPLNPLNESKTTEQFCQYLLHGHKKDAVEYAMNNGLWGHALFLATKMDERTYGNVLARFANCTPFNHPIQTFYQLMSGKQPASAKSCCDDAFGDWKPHLAMILSNAGSRPDIEFKAIVKMGDTLGSKNHIYAAQFCYLMSQTDFSSQSKLGPLLGLNPSAGNILEATQMTEIYEFARSLAEPTFSLGSSFLNSKLNYTMTLIDLGFIEEAFTYCEEIVKKLKLLSGNQAEDLLSIKWSIFQIAERLVRVEESETLADPQWIQDLRQELTGLERQTETGVSNQPGLVESGATVALENNVAVYSDAHIGLDNNIGLQNSPNEYKPEYPVEDVSTSDQQIPSENINNQTPSSYDMTTPAVYNPNQLPNTNNQQPLPMSETNRLHSVSQQPYQPPQMYPDPMVPPTLQMPLPPDQSTPVNPNQYISQSQQSNLYMTPEYTTDYPNNNYIQSGGSYQITGSYSQPPPLQDGPINSSIGASKKKCVRFEDEEKVEDNEDDSEEDDEDEGEEEDDCEDDYLTSKLKEIARGDHVQNDQFAFCHPLHSSVRKNYVGYSSGRQRGKGSTVSKGGRPDTLNYQSEKCAKIGYERQLNSDQIMEEIDRMAYCNKDSSGSMYSSRYRSTYPVDEPLLPGSIHNRFSTFGGTKKTFPIDKLCCTENELCEDHDNFYNGNSNSSSVVSSPTSSSTKPKRMQMNDSGMMSVTCAGPNSFCEGKGFEHSQQKLPPSIAQQANKNDVMSNIKSQDKKEKSGGGGDGKKQGGWITGLISKFKGPNQMILPDDKDPAIVWDEKMKKWVNKSGDEDEVSGPKGPPPSDSQLMGMPPMMSGPPPQASHGMVGGPPPQIQSHPPNSQSMMMAHPNSMMTQQTQPTPYQNQTLPSRLDATALTGNVPLNNMSGLMPNHIINNQPQQNQMKSYMDGYQNPNPSSLPPAPLGSIAPDLPLPGNPAGVGPGGPNNGPPPLTNNKYKLPKNRNIRSGYVDVLNPTTSSRLANGGIGGNNAMNPIGGHPGPGVPNMFIPKPIPGSGDSGPVSFLTPAPPGPLPAQSQLETN